MKKYLSIILFTAVISSCNNGEVASISNTANADKVSEKTVGKNNKDASESIFMVTDTFQTQNKKDIVLSSLKGKPTVVGMIFTKCGAVCPRLTADMKNIAEKLNADKEKVNFVLISFDTQRDNAMQLQMFAREMNLDAEWILLHGNEQAVRTISVLLNVQFEKDAEGNFSHSNLISVLDKNGALAFQKEGIDADHTETINKIEELLK